MVTTKALVVGLLRCAIENQRILLNMATLIQSYEQQYSVLTADVTAKIGRLKVGKEGKLFIN